MKLNRLLAAGILLLVATATQAQLKKAANSGVAFGIRAGVSFQNINGKDAGGSKLSNKLVTRFQGGITADITLADEFSLQPGILFSGKGARFKGSNTNFNLSYIDIPVTFLFKPALGKGNMLLGAGPYIGIGVGGTAKPENGNSSTIRFKNTITTTESLAAYYFRRIDAGANLLVGYEFGNNWSAQINAQLGLAKINPEITGIGNNNAVYKNTGFGVSLAYRFR